MEIFTTPELASAADDRPRRLYRRFPTQPQLAEVAATIRCVDHAGPTPLARLAAAAAGSIIYRAAGAGP